MVKPANIRDGTHAVIADISIRGLWQPQTVALLDVRVVDMMHHHTYIEAQMQCFPRQKREKRKYSSAAEAHQASFTPYPLMECWAERQISYLKG